MLGYPLACDVKGRAVVYGRADKGKAQGGGDTLVETIDLCGDVALVMVQGEDCVVTPLDGLMEDDVGGYGPAGLDAPGLGFFYGGAYLFRLLASQQPAVAAVGVQGGHAYSGGGETPGGEAAVGQLKLGEDAVFGYKIAGCLKDL